jgi:catechol 2,3-dioxygenase-like lactoylglutathione lyase family enzyme
VRKNFLLFIPFAIGFAQISTPNDSGVAMGHLHLRVRDVEAQTRLWVNVLGGKPSKLGQMEMVTLPGVVILWEKGDPDGGTEGSVVGHLGFKVRNLNEVLAKAKANGITLDTVPPSGTFLKGPDNVRVELMEDTALPTAVAHHHIHFFSSAPKDIQAWYAKTFGAKPGKRANFDAADVPGVNLTFSQADSPTVGTKGRSLDHIGFEVKNLEAFTKKLEAQGVKFDVPYRYLPSYKLAIAFCTDPWGTYIELTEGLDAAR